jgi:hypothetical protein
MARKKSAETAAPAVEEKKAPEAQAPEATESQAQNRTFVNSVKVVNQKNDKSDGKYAQVMVNVEQDGEVKKAYTTVRTADQVHEVEGQFGKQTNISFPENMKSNVKLRMDTGEKGEDGKTVYKDVEMSPKELAASHEKANDILHKQYEAKAAQAEAKGAEAEAKGADKEAQAEA